MGLSSSCYKSSKKSSITSIMDVKYISNLLSIKEDQLGSEERAYLRIWIKEIIENKLIFDESLRNIIDHHPFVLEFQQRTKSSKSEENMDKTDTSVGSTMNDENTSVSIQDVDDLPSNCSPKSGLDDKIPSFIVNDVNPKPAKPQRTKTVPKVKGLIKKFESMNLQYGEATLPRKPRVASIKEVEGIIMNIKNMIVGTGYYSQEEVEAVFNRFNKDIQSILN